MQGRGSGAYACEEHPYVTFRMHLSEAIRQNLAGAARYRLPSTPVPQTAPAFSSATFASTKNKNEKRKLFRDQPCISETIEGVLDFVEAERVHEKLLRPDLFFVL